uniref:Uncharacterized protein n=1 Tax=viral metagenome TaxID=1070528 RepID=A0A6M3LH20_9ZZZZ
MTKWQAYEWCRRVIRSCCERGRVVDQGIITRRYIRLMQRRGYIDETQEYELLEEANRI